MMVGVAMLPLVTDDAPVIRAWGWLGRVFWVLLMPGLIYAAFIVLGGPMFAWHARERKAKRVSSEDEA